MPVSQTEDLLSTSTSHSTGQQTERSRSAKDHPCDAELTQQRRCARRNSRRREQQRTITDYRKGPLTISGRGTS